MQIVLTCLSGHDARVLDLSTVDCPVCGGKYFQNPLRQKVLAANLSRTRRLETVILVGCVVLATLIGLLIPARYTAAFITLCAAFGFMAGWLLGDAFSYFYFRKDLTLADRGTINVYP